MLSENTKYVESDETHTYTALRITTESDIEPRLKKSWLIKDLTDPTDKGRCDFDKSSVDVVHSFGGIKVEVLKQTQNLVLSQTKA